MVLKFEEWLIDQQDREDFIGDLARLLGLPDIAPKPSGRNTDEHKNWADIVTRIAQPGDVATFNEAWQQFLVEKQAVVEFSKKEMGAWFPRASPPVGGAKSHLPGLCGRVRSKVRLTYDSCTISRSPA